MTTLRYVVFGQPIPVADTHRREPRFEAEDGWRITRDDATELWRIEGHGVDFVTDGINSWAPTSDGVQIQGESGPLDVVADPMHSSLLTGVQSVLTTTDSVITPKVPRRKR